MKHSLRDIATAVSPGNSLDQLLDTILPANRVTSGAEADRLATAYQLLVRSSTQFVFENLPADNENGSKMKFAVYL